MKSVTGRSRDDTEKDDCTWFCYAQRRGNVSWTRLSRDTVLCAHVGKV